MWTNANKRPRLTMSGFIVLLSLIFTLPTPYSPTGAQDKTPITIGVLASLSGEWGSLGDMTRKGLTLAEEEINASNSQVLGRPIKLSFQDTDEAISATKVISSYRFMRAEGIQLFIGPSGSPGALALGKIAAKDKALLITPSVGIRDFHEAGDNLFNIHGDWESVSAKLAKLAYSKGLRRLAVFSSQHPFEIRQGVAFSKAFQELGGSVVSHQQPNADSQDVKSECLRILKSKPDGVFFSNYNNIGNSTKQLRDLGFKGVQIAALLDSSRLPSADGALDGTLYAQISSGPGEWFVAAFKQRFGELPNYTADTAYDALKALAQAIRDSGTTDPDRVAKYLIKIRVDGASGEISFDDKGGVSRSPSLWKVVGEKLEFVSSL